MNIFQTDLLFKDWFMQKIAYSNEKYRFRGVESICKLRFNSEKYFIFFLIRKKLKDVHFENCQDVKNAVKSKSKNHLAVNKINSTKKAPQNSILFLAVLD